MSEQVGEVEYIQARVVKSVDEWLDEMSVPTLSAMSATIRVPKGSRVRLTQFLALPIADEPEKDAEQWRVVVGFNLWPQTGESVKVSDLRDAETEES